MLGQIKVPGHYMVGVSPTTTRASVPSFCAYLLSQSKMQACCVMERCASWLVGEEGMREPSRIRREGEDERIGCVVLETIGQSPSIRYLLQRYFPPRFYKCWDWKKYLSNFSIIYIFQCFHLHWDALVHQNK